MWFAPRRLANPPVPASAPSFYLYFLECSALLRIELHCNSRPFSGFLHVRARFTSEASVNLGSFRYRQMVLENNLLSSQAKPLSVRWLAFGWASLLLTLVSLVWSDPSSAQAPSKRDVLILSDVGMSHSLTSEITQQIVAGVRETPDRHVEFYSESLDLQSFPGRPSREDTQDWLAKKYGDHKLEVVVAVGPGAIGFLLDDAQTLFRDVPILSLIHI